MRSLIIRFKDIEGPGIIAQVLKNKGYAITYQDAFRFEQHLIPNAHLNFDLFVMMGGPQTVTDDSDYKLFKPYYQLVEHVLAQKDKKLIGVCLGSQILARVLGAKVQKGTKGTEVGFSKMKILKKDAQVFKDITENEILGFHLHGDTFDIPKSAEHLLSTEMYPNQMFAYKNQVYGLQCHIELDRPTLEVWTRYIPEIQQAIGNLSPMIIQQNSEVQKYGNIIFNNII